MGKKQIKSRLPDWLSTAVFYQIYPQSFYDSNRDGIGDIPGIIKKLDYIYSLGCNAIWINPCFESPFRDAGYYIADYYKVAKRYGTNSDLKHLFKEAKKRSIKICLDLVSGHTSIDHPWFRESCKAETNKYSNRYIWTKSVWESAGDDYRIINGFSERDGNFITNFFWFQPALNYGFARPDPAKPWQLSTSHPDVRTLRREIMNIMRYWLDMGADGFRVDMASSLVKGDNNQQPEIRESIQQRINRFIAVKRADIINHIECAGCVGAKPNDSQYPRCAVNAIGCWSIRDVTRISININCK